MSRPPYSGVSTSLADFKQLSLLGEGAYSAVYKVLRLADREVYALKKVKLPSLSDKEKQNALNEVRLLASVNHDNVIAYKEAFFDDKTRCLCIVQECADAGDLLQQINRCKQERAYIREGDVWRYMNGMCQGLKALHDLRILHRDMKCANVFLSAAREGAIAKLGDFNVSKVAKRGLCMTQTGTPYYASPEVWRDMPYDGKSDMWSLGCVLYEMVALRPPFRAEDMEGLYRKVLRGQYPRIPAHYSQDLSDVIGALLQVHPRHRPNVDQLLQTPAMCRHTAGRSPTGDGNGGYSDLLNTIKLPKNAIDLSGCLPKPRYATLEEPSKEADLPQKSRHGSPDSSPERRHSMAQLARGPTRSVAQLPQMPRQVPRVVPTPHLLPVPHSGNAGAETPSVLSMDNPRQALTPTRLGPQGPQPGQDSLDTYIQQRHLPTPDPPRHEPQRAREGSVPLDNDGSPGNHQPLAHQNGVARAVDGGIQRAADGNGASRVENSGRPGPTINPRYFAQQYRNNQREPLRPMSIYARQQYAVVEQHQQATPPKETTGRSRRSLIPRLF